MVYMSPSIRVPFAMQLYRYARERVDSKLKYDFSWFCSCFDEAASTHSPHCLLESPLNMTIDFMWFNLFRITNPAKLANGRAFRQTTVHAAWMLLRVRAWRQGCVTVANHLPSPLSCFTWYYWWGLQQCFIVPHRYNQVLVSAIRFLGDGTHSCWFATVRLSSSIAFLFRVSVADSGFVLIVDRRKDKWPAVRATLVRIAVSCEQDRTKKLLAIAVRCFIEAVTKSEFA